MYDHILLRPAMRCCIGLAVTVALPGASSAGQQQAEPAEAFMRQLQAGPLAIAAWTDATVERGKSQSREGGVFRAIMVEKQEKPVGYILFFERGDKTEPVAFSGSAFADDLAEQLRTDMKFAGACPGTTGVQPDVIMVPTAESHGFALVSPLDASAAAMLDYWHWIRGHYLFDHFFVLDTRTDLPFPKPQRTFPPEDELTDFPPPPAEIPEDPNLQHPLFRKEVIRIHDSIRQDFAVTPNRERLPTREIPMLLRTFDDVHKLADKWLGYRLSPTIRRMLVAEEQQTAGGPFNNCSVAPSVVDALLVGRGYISNAESPEAGINRFLRTRAVKLTCRKLLFDPTQAHPCPSMLLSPSGRAYVLVGRVEFAGHCWAAVIDPATVRPIVRKHKERLASVRRAQGRPVSTSRPESRPVDAREAARRQAEQEVLYSDCPMTGNSDAIHRGLHYLRAGALENWTVLTVTEE